MPSSRHPPWRRDPSQPASGEPGAVQCPVPHRARVRRPADREQLGQERGDLAERRQRRIPGRDVGELRCDGTTAEVQGGEAPRLARAMAGADQQPPDPDRHRAEQRAEGRPVMALAGQPSPAGRAPATTLARHGHLRRHDLGLQRRREPLRLLQPEPELGETGLLFAFDPGDLGLGRHARPQLRDQLHPPHQLRHRPPPPP